MLKPVSDRHALDYDLEYGSVSGRAVDIDGNNPPSIIAGVLEHAKEEAGSIWSKASKRPKEEVNKLLLGGAKGYPGD
ncbi:hypothetical protein M408DRAFT_30127 [Serendipita vermifera MAFF 305830]|uniref:Uncharacterized protein n=1 Tax=Serendipita vermifera MAFF 305830 TaxID=933852 RepID=A0A0C3ANA0_SERVB|nr:hypothetical protein M408DRAFT_30127 [Serendipita vermifera MAFF 305830]